MYTHLCERSYGLRSERLWLAPSDCLRQNPTTSSSLPMRRLWFVSLNCVTLWGPEPRLPSSCLLNTTDNWCERPKSVASCLFDSLFLGNICSSSHWPSKCIVSCPFCFRSYPSFRIVHAVKIGCPDSQRTIITLWETRSHVFFLRVGSDVRSKCFVISSPTTAQKSAYNTEAYVAQRKRLQCIIVHVVGCFGYNILRRGKMWTSSP